MSDIQIVGRSSSHFTRVATMFAHELGLAFELVVVPDLTSLDVAVYGGHPALKIPTLHAGESTVFGAENICRKLAELAGDPRVVFPEHVTADVGRCAQELVWHAMTVQVQIVVGTVFAKLPADNAFFVKARTGLGGALAWLDAHVDEALRSLPADRRTSVLEVTLFCLVEHLGFRPTVPVEPYEQLRRFARAFATRESARRTVFRFDVACRRPALDPATVPPRTTSGYPEELRARVLPREKRALGDALGLTKFGVNLTTLFPGKESSMRHYHSHEDELVFVLEGELVLRTDEGEQVLHAGMCAGFPAGSQNGHQLVNRSDRPARYLEIGNRDPDDTVVYTDVDLAAVKTPDGWSYTINSRRG